MGFEISQFFKKIQGSFAGEILLRKNISAVIEKNIGIQIPFEKISIKKGIINLDVNQSAKSQIFIKKQAMLKDILESNPNSGIKDIR